MEKDYYKDYYFIGMKVKDGEYVVGRLIGRRIILEVDSTIFISSLTNEIIYDEDRGTWAFAYEVEPDTIELRMLTRKEALELNEYFKEEAEKWKTINS